MGGLKYEKRLQVKIEQIDSIGLGARMQWNACEGVTIMIQVIARCRMSEFEFSKSS